MRIVFCADPLDPTRVDAAFEGEFEAAKSSGLEYGLLNFERLTSDNNALSAVRRIRASEPPEIAVYRGWMLRPETYTALYEALHQRGLLLINTPDAYRHCHHLPESYQLIEKHTPNSIWLPYPLYLDIEKVFETLKVFGNKPLIVKDYVKSRKHDWAEACFIPAADDYEAVQRVVRRFLELQGDNLQEGLVFREFVSLQRVGTHSISGMPLTKEFRLFFLDGRLLHAARYWGEGEYSDTGPPLDTFQALAQTIQSRFFTMDIAQCMDGTWIVVELGDAQVAGLPDELTAVAFYEAMKTRLGNN